MEVNIKLDVVYLALMCSVAGVLELFRPSMARKFIEQDPAISKPYLPSTVGIISLITLAVLLPLIVMLVMRSYHVLGPELTIETLLICFGQAMSSQWALAGCLKGMVGRLRPNFFALCNYNGYGDNPKELGGKEYEKKTHFGTFGNYTNCKNKAGEAAARLSFPSGHAATSFAGLGFLGLAIIASARRAGAPFSMQILAAAPAFTLAAYISATRVQDCWHFESDVLAGSVMGLSVSYCFFHSRLWPLIISQPEARCIELLEQTENSDSGSITVGATSEVALAEASGTS